MKLAVFDLDYTIWRPEMYQIRGPPKLTPIESRKLTRRDDYDLSTTLVALKEVQTTREGMMLTDRGGVPIRVFDGAAHALREINRMRRKGSDIRAAIASRTDEPRWARICLEHMAIHDDEEDGETLTALKDCFEDRLIEISYGSKVGHLERLHRKTGIPYEEMSFFDNEHWNIQDVSRALPGVKCFYTPDGMTRRAWKDAKAAFGL